MKRVISVVIWIMGTILTITLFFAVLFFTIILFPFDRKKKVSHAQCFWWADIIVGLNPYWDIKVKGLENIDKQKTYVIVANHQSLADIVLLYKTRMQFKWVAKESLFKVPFVGWNLHLIEHIKLRRGDFTSIKNVYKKAAWWLRNDMSVLFFPEGTRSDSEKMGEFQNGAFKLAIKEKKPILPVCIRGTRNAVPKGSWVFDAKASGSITVLPPIETQNMQIGDFVKVREMVFCSLENVPN